MSAVRSLLRRAMRERRPVGAYYRGRWREFCPHVLGEKGIREHVLGYQFGGSSSTGLGPPGSPSNWRCFDLDLLDGVTLGSGPWFTAHNHSRPQSCVDCVDAEVRW